MYQSCYNKVSDKDKESSQFGIIRENPTIFIVQADKIMINKEGWGIGVMPSPFSEMSIKK